MPVSSLNIALPIHPKNAVTFFGKRNLWPNTASKLAVQILTYTKGYASVLSSQLFLAFSSNLAFVPKNKNQMPFSGLPEYLPLFVLKVYRISHVFTTADFYLSYGAQVLPSHLFLKNFLTR